MSITQTQPNTTQSGFAEATAKPKPRLYCVGNVTEVEDAYVSKKGVYVVLPIALTALGAGRDQKFYLLYRPEWFVQGFRPESLYDQLTEKEADGVISVYRRHIHERGAVSALRGLCGSEDAFKALANLLLQPSAETITLEFVTTVIRTFLEGNIGKDNEPVKVGYTLKQQRTKTDEVDADTGKPIYIAENRYEIDQFWEPTKAALKNKAKYAEGSDGKTQMTYSAEIPF